MYREFFMNPPTRFIGYSFAIYEVMRDILSSSNEKMFHLLGALFVFLHSIDEALEGVDAKIMFFIFMDTLIYESFASILIPICIAKAAFDLTRHLLSELDINRQVTRYGPVFIAIFCIFLISKPLDELVNRIMSKTIRQIYF